MNREHVLALITGAGAMLLLLMLFVIPHGKEELTCEEMVAELWATRACLKHRPACEGLTQEKFLEYHNIRNRFEEQCGADSGDDWLSQSIESNSNGKD